MVINSPWYDSIDIISLHQVKKGLGVNPMGLSVTWADSLYIIALQTDETNC